MRVTVLASGSAGNAALFEVAGHALLVDAGLPVPALRARMRAAGVTRAPDAVLVTHAHGDHHRYAAEVALHHGVPVYASEETRRVVPFHGAPSVRVFGAREPFALGPWTVRPMPVSHDAPQVALRLEAGGAVAVLATDLGEVPAGLDELLRGADLALLESNHDPDMLWRGPYSASLKRRVASRRGHLSNDQLAELLRRLDPAVSTVVLMHLSETNNLPDLARDRAAEALADHPAQLLVAAQRSALQVHARSRQPTLPGIGL